MIIKRNDMDRFKIAFKCNRKPDVASGLFGFEPEKYYRGRAYNGLFEISSEWGKGKPTMVLDKKIFYRYFEIVMDTASH